MAKNPNRQKTNRHSLFLAATGYGKTHALQKIHGPKLKAARVIYWDPGEDHKARLRVGSLKAFYAGLIEQANSGKISIALSMDRAEAGAFEIMAKMVWQILDGKKDTYLIVEEAAGIQAGIGKAGKEWGVLIREGRKFGLVILATSQRSQEIDKTIFSQVQNLYVGCHSIIDAKKIGGAVGVDPRLIHNQTIGQFFLKEMGPKSATQVKIPA